MQEAVVYIAKVRILEQITTRVRNFTTVNCCCLYRKGKNFRANHNNIGATRSEATAVVYIAKVRILEQITTSLMRKIVLLLLLFISQR